MVRFFFVLTVLYSAVLFASALYVALRGRAPERVGIAIMVAGSVLTVPAFALFGTGWANARMGVLAVDSLVLLAFLALALRSERYWPLWVAGFQLTGVMTHIAMLIEPSRVLQAYAIAQGFWAYPMIGAIVLATWRRQHPAKATPPPSSPRSFGR